jgi:serine/threonine protein kinase/Leucine-rich repeat (LRR) protein/class 3 adenylate cyclase
MVLRVSQSGVALYANQAFCRYAGKPREEIEGCALGDLAKITSGEVSECFTQIGEHLQPNALVTDSEGRVFEVKTARELGVLDIVLDEVTHGEKLEEILRSASGTPVEDLDEEELRTLRHPDLRNVTICRARLQTDAKTTGALTPWDQRILTNAFIEELSEGLIAKGCTIMPPCPGGVAGLSGAPRHYADHALRALEAAFEQVSCAARLQNSLFADGREMPPLGWAIATGDAVIGTFGGYRSMNYSAEGRCVDLAERLSALALPGEVLVTEDSMVSLLQNLPEGWSSVRTTREVDPDLGPYASHAGSIQAIDGSNQRGVWLFGPGVSEDWQKAVFVFDYLWSFQSGSMKEPVSVLRAIRLGGVSQHVQLSLDRVPDQGFVHRLGKYRLLSVIGHGGMGRVWRAHDIYGNIVAIKTLNAPQATSPESVKRFRREAEVMGRLQHRNICRIFEMNEHEGSHYIVMEFVDGLSLADILYSGVKSTDGKEDLSSIIKAARAARESSSDKPEAAPKEEKPGTHRQETMRLPVEQAVAIFLKVCSAVEFAHTHGVLHRDLKPGNILLRSDGEPLVADFGLAKLSSAEAESSLSLSGNVLGTVENMAPEQAASSKSVDARADVYSLGTILFQMVTGNRHFAATGTLLVDIQTLQTHEPLRPRSINPQVDPDLELIILKCLRQNPADRYRGVAALLADMERYLKGETISARPVTAVEVFRKLIQRNRAASIVAAAALALILVIVTGAVFSLARQLDITEQNKNLAEERLRQIEEKESLYAQTLEGRKIAEMSTQDLQSLIHDKEKREQVAALELKKNKAALAVAVAEAAAEKLHREEAETKIRELSAKLKEAIPSPHPLNSSTTSVATATPQATPSKPFINPLAVQMEIEKIESGFREDFSSFNLSRLESTPAEALELLDKRIDETSSVLLKSPQSVRGWMLMGFLHLAGLEFKAAERSFEIAIANSSALVAGGQRVDRQQPSYRPIHSGPVPFSPLSHAESAPSLRDFARDNSSRRPAFGKNAPELAIPLRQISHALSDTASDAIAFFISKPKMSRVISSPGSPMDRKPSNNEIALRLLLDNDLSSAPIVKSGFGPNELDVTLEGHVKNLSLISSQTKSLTIRNAQKIDTQNLLNFSKLTRLDLNGSDITDPPPLPRTTLKLSQLGLANTKIQSVKFAAGLTNLTRIDISNTGVTDLTPLANCKSLRTLEAGGCRLENLRVLKELPGLRNLTISPEFLKNPQELGALKSIPIPSIRTPDEPADQSAVEFFRKHLPVSQN